MRFRNGLRALLVAHHGEPAEEGAVDALNDAVGGARLSVRFRTGAEPRLVGEGDGTDRFIAEVLRGVLDGLADGTWPRLKIWKNDSCAVAFYDASKNQSRCWCSMAVCGNRMKARAYRDRHATAR